MWWAPLAHQRLPKIGIYRVPFFGSAGAWHGDGSPRATAASYPTIQSPRVSSLGSEEGELEADSATAAFGLERTIPLGGTYALIEFASHATGVAGLYITLR
jgi:hypothetical protein